MTKIVGFFYILLAEPPGVALTKKKKYSKTFNDSVLTYRTKIV